MEQMTHFPKYYCNENGWLFSKCGKTGRFMAKATQMAFPYGKTPYYVIQKQGKKYILRVTNLNKDSKGEEL